MNKDILEKDYSNPVVTKKAIENIKRYPQFYIGTSVRFQMGKIYTNEEFSQRSDEVLSRELPGVEKMHVLRKVFKPKKKIKTFKSS